MILKLYCIFRLKNISKSRGCNNVGKNYREKYPILYQNSETNLSERYKKALQEANQAAILLKEKYGAQTVWIFGSLANKEKFHSKSDIDLAETGIPEDRFYAAVGAVNRGNFKVDLVDKDDCREIIRKAIKKEGIII